MRFLIILSFLMVACGGSGGSGGAGGSSGAGGAGGSSGSGGSGGSGGTGGSAGHDASADASLVDSLPMTCGNMEAGTCSASAEACHCCPGAGPTQHCLCTTACQTDTDCTDSSRPHCEHDPSNPNAPGFCTPIQSGCCWLCG